MATYSYKGVEYEFVKAEKKFLEELKCPICLDLVSDPVQTSCGHLFCGNCIKGIKQCPVDRKTFTTNPDPFNKRRVLNFKVKCPNKKKGCKWQGNLGDADKHVSVNCDHLIVKCYNTGCNVKLEKRQLTRHMQNECPHRMYQCPHCNKEDTYSEVITTHFTTCVDIPLPCPAGCGTLGLVRRDMAHHLSEDCPNELVPCTYAIAECQQIVKRKDLQQHLLDKDQHLDTVLSSYASLTHVVQCLVFGGIPNIPLPLRQWLQNEPTSYPSPPWVVKMEGVQEEKKKSEEWFGDPVYSHFGGYKMCLCVYANGNGDGKGTHVSVYAYLMQGDNDDNLKWPFKGTIKVSLLNQLEDGQHHTMVMWPPDKDIPERTSGRVTEGERAGRGWGYPQFIPHQDLIYKGDKNCQYLKDNTLFFRVNCFEPKLD